MYCFLRFYNFEARSYDDRRNYRQGERRFGGRRFEKNELGQRLSMPDWKRKELINLRKDFYQENPSVTNRSEEEIAKFFTDNGVTVKGEDVPRPIHYFDEAGLPGKLNKSIKSTKSVQCLVASLFVLK